MLFTKLLKRKLAGTLIVALCATLAVPVAAGAQQTSPTNSQYEDSLTQISTGGGQPGGGQPPSGTETASGLGGNVGPLPFTGFDVIAMAAVALAVTGLGLALQRAVAREPGA